MRILFITYYFPPYNTIAAVRTGKTAKILYEMKHDIKVVTSAVSQTSEGLQLEIPQANIYVSKWISLTAFIKNKLKLNDFIFSNTEQKQDFNLVRIIKKGIINIIKKLYITFLNTPDDTYFTRRYAIKECNKIIKSWRPDIIYASAGPYTSLIIASKISQKHKIPYVGELRDLWVDNHYNKTTFIDTILEKKTLSKASALVTVSAPLVSILQAKYPNIKSYEIRNAFDSSDFQLEKNAVINDNKIKIVHTGDLYEGKRDPTILFECIAKSDYLKENVICSFYGTNSSFIKILAKKYNIEDCIKIFPRVARKEALLNQMESDILLLLTWNNPHEKGIFTAKLFEYIGTAKPILTIGANQDVAAECIMENGFGLASNDPKEIESFIKECKTPQFIKKISESYTKNREKFERKIQVEKLNTIFESVSEKLN